MVDVVEAIKSRRTIHDFTDEPLPEGLIEEMLEAAVWAPNHKLTEPWNFIVVQGEAKRRLAEMRRRVKMQGFPEQDSPRAQRAGEFAYNQMANVPAVIVVTCPVSEDPTRTDEDYAATAVAIQNMALTAWSKGFGVFWGTGALTRDPEALEFLGVPEDHRVVGIVFVGRPESVPEMRRTPASEKTRWLE